MNTSLTEQQETELFNTVHELIAKFGVDRIGDVIAKHLDEQSEMACEVDPKLAHKYSNASWKFECAAAYVSDWCLG